MFLVYQTGAIAAVASLFTLRKKRPDLPRPYKTWGYPVMPLLFIVALSGLLINTLVNKPVESIAGLGIVVIGIPVYYYWRRKYKKISLQNSGQKNSS